jgi:putative SOS response-associated peptidase YedK
MCGRFTFNSNLKDVEKTFFIIDITCKVSASYNIAPTQEVLTVIRYDDHNKLGKLRWGLVPSWDCCKIQSGRRSASCCLESWKFRLPPFSTANF